MTLITVVFLLCPHMAERQGRSLGALFPFVEQFMKAPVIFGITPQRSYPQI